MDLQITEDEAKALAALLYSGVTISTLNVLGLADLSHRLDSEVGMYMLSTEKVLFIDPATKIIKA